MVVLVEKVEASMIRPAVLNDVPAIIALGEHVIQRSPLLHSKIDPLKARKAIFQTIHNKSHLALVAEKDGVVVGCLLGLVVDYWYSKDRYATDLAFYVDSQHGDVAPWLMKRFIKWARAQKNVVDVLMGISTGLDKQGDAGRMYEKLGFSAAGGMFTYMLTGEKHERVD